MFYSFYKMFWHNCKFIFVHHCSYPNLHKWGSALICYIQVFVFLMLMYYAEMQCNLVTWQPAKELLQLNSMHTLKLGKCLFYSVTLLLNLYIWNQKETMIALLSPSQLGCTRSSMCLLYRQSEEAGMYKLKVMPDHRNIPQNGHGKGENFWRQLYSCQYMCENTKIQQAKENSVKSAQTTLRQLTSLAHTVDHK